jgi:hypothetical protein
VILFFITAKKWVHVINNHLSQFVSCIVPVSKIPTAICQPVSATWFYDVRSRTHKKLIISDFFSCPNTSGTVANCMLSEYPGFTPLNRLALLIPFHPLAHTLFTCMSGNTQIGQDVRSRYKRLQTFLHKIWEIQANPRKLNDVISFDLCGLSYIFLYNWLTEKYALFRSSWEQFCSVNAVLAQANLTSIHFSYFV